MNVHKKILEKHGNLENAQLLQGQSTNIPPNQQQTAQQKQEEEEIQAKNQEFQQFNATSTHIRTTCGIFPKSKACQIDAKLPFAVIFQPYGQSVKNGFPSVSYGSFPILRCNNCRAYVNPFMKFIDNGSYVKCNLCQLITKVQYSGQKPDSDPQRADLISGSYDIKAGQEYQARPPMPPTYFFMIDVSNKSEGILPIIGQIIKDLIINEQFNERTLFGFLTFDTVIHLYNFNSKLKQPQMYVLTDSTDLPTPDEYLFNLQDSKEIIVSFLDNLSKLFLKPQQKSTQFMNALNLSQTIMKNIGGKLLIVTSHKIEELDYRNNNNKVQQPYIQPSNDLLKVKSQELHYQYICPSIFIIPNAFNNLITLNQLAKYLNGDLFYYDNPSNYVQKFYYDFRSVLIKDYSWEAVFRIRLSTGWKIKSIYGNYSVKSNDLLSVTCMDDQKTITYELELTQPNANSETLYLQTVLLYTSTNGERRIRVHNYALPLSNQIQTIYKSIDEACLAAVLTKFSLAQLNNAKVATIAKDFLVSAARGIFSMGNTFKLTFDSLKAYLLGLLKQRLLNYTYDSASILNDYTCYFRSLYSWMGVDEMSVYLVPQLYNLSNLQQGECEYDEDGYFIYPQLASLCLEEIQNGGLFLMDIGHSLILYITKIHDEQTIIDIFGQHYNNITLVEDHLYANSSNPINDKIYHLLTELRNTKSQYIPLYIEKQGSKTYNEDVFLQHLIYDDLNKNFRMGYEEFAQYIS